MTYQWDTALLRDTPDGEEEFEIRVLYEYTPGRPMTWHDPPECAEVEIVAVEYRGKEFAVTPEELVRLEEGAYLQHIED